MNLLLSSAGRRVELIGCFRRALTKLSLGGEIIAVDASPYAPALQAADRAFVVPRCDETGFLDRLLEICAGQSVSAVIPTIDTELTVLAAAHDRFAAAGVRLWMSSPETVAIADDKRLTHNWLTARGLPMPAQCEVAAALSAPLEWPAPLILKPARGSASVGIRRLDDREYLPGGSCRDLIVQRVAPGTEYTVHVWVDDAGRTACAVPCRRMEVRAGEVSKAITVKDPGLMSLAAAAAEALPGSRGPLNVQIFQDDDGAMRIIEINARFGGGYPLADRSGAAFARWLIEETLGLRPRYQFDAWRDELVMLRFDEAFFASAAELSAGFGRPSLACRKAAYSA